jgi:hypothetical protein
MTLNCSSTFCVRKKLKKKSSPTQLEIKIKVRKERNAESARRSRMHKNQIEAKKDMEVEEMALINRKLAKKVETLECLKHYFESLNIFDTFMPKQLGINESNGSFQTQPKETYSTFDAAEPFVISNEYDCFIYSAIPTFIGQENDEITQSIEEESLQDYQGYNSNLSLCNTF